MVKIEIDIPDELKFLKEKVSSIDWSYLATRAIEKRLNEVAKYREIVSKSKATEKDVEEVSEEIKDNIWEHYKKHAK